MLNHILFSLNLHFSVKNSHLKREITLIECEAQPQTTYNILPLIFWFYYLPKIYLWLRLWQYHLSNKQTAKSSDLRSYFDYLPQVHLGVKLWQYYWSNKQTVKYQCITMYNYTLLCTISTRTQLLRRQHRKRTSKKSEMETYKETTKIARNMLVLSIWTKPWCRI